MSKKKRISLHGSIVLSGKAMGKEEDFRQDRDKPFLAPEGYADHLLADGFAYVPDKTKKSQEPPAGTGSQGSKSPKDPPAGGGAGEGAKTGEGNGSDGTKPEGQVGAGGTGDA